LKILKCPNCGAVHIVSNRARGALCPCTNAPFGLDAVECLIGFLAPRWIRRARIFAEQFDRNLSDVLIKLLAIQEEAQHCDVLTEATVRKPCDVC
jgi:hypothetical protein